MTPTLLLPARARLAVLTFALAAATAVACGSSSDSTFGTTSGGANDGGAGSSGSFGASGGPGEGGSGVTVAALAFDPPIVTLDVDGVTPKSAQFRLKATQFDNSVVEVTPESLEFDRPDLASATNGDPVTLTTTSAFGGAGRLHAVYGGREAQAQLTINVARKDVGAGVSPAEVAALDAAGLATDPTLTTLRYPYDKTVFPLGLTSPLVMWDAPVNNDVYKVHLEQTNYTYDVYSVVAQPAQVRVDQLIWDRLTASNGGDALKLTVSRYAVASGTAYSSASESWTIAPASLRGAIYYWYASQIPNPADPKNPIRQGHIARIRPGVGAKPETLDSGNANPCMGCHAVSADGSTLAAAVEGAPTGDPASYPYTNGWENGRAWASFDLPAGTVRKQTTMTGSDLALTPDGKYAVFGGRAQTNSQAKASPEQWQAGSKYMSLADTKTGTVVVDSGLDDVVLTDNAHSMAMPAFSPDGHMLATVEFSYTGSGAVRDNVLPDSTQILLLEFSQDTLKFAPTPKRLPLSTWSFPTTGIGYPSFTPDSKYVAFHVGNHSTGCFDACDDTVAHKGEIELQSTDGVSTSIRLTNLDDPPNAADRGLSVEPTFNPVQRGSYSWVVFTSMRDWGNELTGTPINGKRRLWVAAIDGAPGATDPSHPAFYLEGQENTPNMRGFWTLAACTATPSKDTASPDGGASTGACQAGFECCSGFCDRGVCVDASKIACVGVGGDCTTASDCCNAQSVSCQGGKCAPNVVK